MAMKVQYYNQKIKSKNKFATFYLRLCAQSFSTHRRNVKINAIEATFYLNVTCMAILKLYTNLPQEHSRKDPCPTWAWSLPGWGLGNYKLRVHVFSCKLFGVPIDSDLRWVMSLRKESLVSGSCWSSWTDPESKTFWYYVLFHHTSVQEEVVIYCCSKFYFNQHYKSAQFHPNFVYYHLISSYRFVVLVYSSHWYLSATISWKMNIICHTHLQSLRVF